MDKHKAFAIQYILECRSDDRLEQTDERKDVGRCPPAGGDGAGTAMFYL